MDQIFDYQQTAQLLFTLLLMLGIFGTLKGNRNFHTLCYEIFDRIHKLCWWVLEV